MQNTEDVIKIIEHIRQSSLQKWYLPTAVTFSFLDAYIPVVPNEVFLALGVFPRPKKWLSVAAAFTIASALGATSLAVLTHIAGMSMIDRLFPHLMADPRWIETLAWMHQHGALGLALVALSPFPQHAAVIILALTEPNFVAIFIAVLVGRFLKYAFVAWLAQSSPSHPWLSFCLKTRPTSTRSALSDLV